MLIATRNACLTGDINHIIFGDNNEYLSYTKGRIDLTLDIKKHNKFRTPTKAELLSHLNDKDYSGVYEQSVTLSHFQDNRQPKYFIIDQYSELTDKRFEHDNGYVFAGHYSHLNKDNLKDCGAISTNNIQQIYDEYFSFMKHRWPNTKIIFTHFPIEYEKREEYINRWNDITNAIENICSKYNIQNIHADKESIEHVGLNDDGNPYHFTKKTAQNMAAKIKL